MEGDNEPVFTSPINEGVEGVEDVMEGRLVCVSISEGAIVGKRSLNFLIEGDTGGRLSNFLIEGDTGGRLVLVSSKSNLEEDVADGNCSSV